VHLTHVIASIDGPPNPAISPAGGAGGIAWFIEKRFAGWRFQRL
jgi:hypothetical protein